MGAFKNSLGINGSITAGTTLAVTTTANIAIGDLIVVRAAADNLSATTPTFTCADSGGNTYTTHQQGAVNVTGGSGVAGAIMCSKATVAITAGGTITVTCSGSVTARAMYAESFTGYSNTTRSAPVKSTGASTAATSTTSGAVAVGDLILGFSAVESRGAATGDSDSTDGTWSALVQSLAAASGTDAARVEINGQYKISTGVTALAYDNTVINTDWVAGLVVIQFSDGTATPATISMPWTMPLPLVLPHSESGTPATIAAPFAVPAATASGGGGGGGTVTFDAVGPAGGGGSYTAAAAGNGGTGSWTHVCTGTDLVLIVGLSVNHLTGGNVSGNSATVTYNGVSMTSFGALLNAGATNAWLQGWYLLDPASGSHTVNFTLAGTVQNVDIEGGSISFAGADNVENYTTNDPSTTATNSPTLTVTSATGRQVVAIANHGDTISGVAGGTTQRVLLNQNNFSAGGNFVIGSAAGAASVGLGFTSSVDDGWAMLGASVTAVAGGGADGTATPAAITSPFALPGPAESGGSTVAPATIPTAAVMPGPTEIAGSTVAPATISSPHLLPAPSATGSSTGTGSPATISRAWTLPAPALTAGSAPAPATIARAWLLPAPAASGSSPGTAAPATIARAWTLPAATASGGGGGGSSPPTISLLSATFCGWDNFAVGVGSPATITVTSPSITPGTNCELILMLSVLASGTSQFNATTVTSTGSGPTWTLVEATNAATSYDACSTIWKAAIGGTSPGTFTVAATYQALTTSDAAIHLMSILKSTGHDTTTPTGGKETVTRTVGNGNGAQSITLDAAPATNDVTLAQCLVDENTVNQFSTFGTGTWTTLQDGSASTHQLAYNVGYRSSSTSATVPWSDVNSGADNFTATQAAIVVNAGAATSNATPATISAPFTLPAPTASGPAGATATPATIPAPFVFPAVAGIDITVDVPTIARAWLLPAPSATGSVPGTATPATIARAWLLPAPTATGASSGTATPATIARAWLLPAPAASGSVTAGPATIVRAWLLPAPTASGSSAGTANPATIARAWLLPAPAKVAGAVATPLKIQVAVVMGTPQAGNVFFINITFTALSPVFARPPQLTHRFTTTHTAGAPTFRTRRPSAPALAHDTKPPVLGHGDPDDPTVTPRTTTTKFTPRNPGPPTL